MAATDKDYKGMLSVAVSRAVGFLSDAQLPSGEYRLFAAADHEMARNCRFDSSPFATTFILHSLRFLHTNKVDEMIKKGVNYLSTEIEGPGLLRYWSSCNSLHEILPPDADDTCCASYILNLYDRPFPPNREIIGANINPDGLFYTWFAPRNSMPKMINETLLASIGKESIFNLYASGELNKVDHAVNVNVIQYLGESITTIRAIDSVIDTVATAQERACSTSYPEVITFYYLISRAFFAGVHSFGKIRKTLIRRLLSMQGADGGFGNELLTSLAVCTMENFQKETDARDKAVEYILSSQRKDGSWRKLPLYLGPAPYYGSEELTTALCIEALFRYEQKQ